MIVLLGETGAGKTTLEKLICEKYHFYKIVAYTTRPTREGEENHKDYHFLPEDEFINRLEKDNFIAHYVTDNGWHYGIDKKDCTYDAISILTPSGLRDIKQYDDIHTISIYITADREERIMRAVYRGDNKLELLRRLKSDDIDFIEIVQEVDYIIRNDGYINNMLKEFDEIMIKEKLD